MSHLSENNKKLSFNIYPITKLDELDASWFIEPNAHLFWFSEDRTDNDAERSDFVYSTINEIIKNSHKESVFCFLANAPDAARIIPFLNKDLKYQLWIAIKAKLSNCDNNLIEIPHQHQSLLVFTRYKETLKHSKTRIQYTYCPACGKTTKDYGGKKHTYHEYGTLMSDVWRDITYEPNHDISDIVDRLRDLFGISPYHHLNIYDMRKLNIYHEKDFKTVNISREETHVIENDLSIESQLINEDCLTALKKMHDNSIDFGFADPPYNLKKNTIIGMMRSNLKNISSGAIIGSLRWRE